MRELPFLPEESQQDIEARVGALFQSAEPGLGIGIARDWTTDQKTIETALEFSVARGDIASAISLLESVRFAIGSKISELTKSEEALHQISLQMQALEERKRRTASTRKGKETRRFHEEIDKDIARLNEARQKQSDLALRLQEGAPILSEQHNYFTRYFFFLKALAQTRAGQSIEEAMQTTNSKEEEIKTALLAFFKQRKTLSDGRLLPMSPEDMQMLADRRGLTSPVPEEIAIDREAQSAVERLKTQCREVAEVGEKSGYPEFLTLAGSIGFRAEQIMLGNPSDSERERANALCGAYELSLGNAIDECLSRSVPFHDTLPPPARTQLDNVMTSIAHGFPRVFNGCDDIAPRLDEIRSIAPEDKLLVDIAGYELANDKRIHASVIERLRESASWDEDDLSNINKRHFLLDRVEQPASARKKIMGLESFSDSSNILRSPKYIFTLRTIGKHYPHLLSESVHVRVERMVEQYGGMQKVIDSLQANEKFDQALKEHLDDVYLFTYRLIQLTLDNRSEARALAVSEGAKDKLVALLKERMLAIALLDEPERRQNTEAAERVVECIESLRNRIQFYAYGARIMPVLPDNRGEPKVVNAFLGTPFYRAFMYLFEGRLMGAVMDRYIDETFDGLRLPGLDFSKRGEFLRGLKTNAQLSYSRIHGDEQFQRIVRSNARSGIGGSSLFFGPIDIESFPQSLQELGQFRDKFREVGFDLAENPRAWGELLRSVLSGEFMQFLVEWES